MAVSINFAIAEMNKALDELEKKLDAALTRVIQRSPISQEFTVYLGDEFGIAELKLLWPRYEAAGWTSCIRCSGYDHTFKFSYKNKEPIQVKQVQDNTALRAVKIDS
jgi:hypothetical protein